MSDSKKIKKKKRKIINVFDSYLLPYKTTSFDTDAFLLFTLRTLKVVVYYSISVMCGFFLFI